MDDNSKPTNFDDMVDDNDNTPSASYAEGGEVSFDSLVSDPVNSTIGIPNAINSSSSAPIPVTSPTNNQNITPNGPTPATNNQNLSFDSLVDDNEQYKTPGQQALAALEAAGQGVLGPIAPLVEGAFGATAKGIRGRAEANPGTHALGELGGFAGSMLTGVGEGALVADAGKATAKAVGEGTNLSGIVGNAMARGAVENAIIQSGDEITKMILNDPNQSAQTAVADIGLSALLGGGLSGVVGAASPLWKAANGNKLGQLIEDFNGKINDHLTNPDPVNSVTKELSDYYKNIKSAASEVYGPEGLKAQDIAKLMPKMNDKIATQVTSNTEKLESSIAKLKNDANLPLLQEHVDKYLQAVDTSDPSQIFNATQDLKQQLQEYAKYNSNITPLNEKTFRNIAKDLAFDLRESLEDKDVWGKAAERQNAINKSFSEYLPTLKDFEKKFTVDVAGDKTIDPGKINTFINQVGKPNAEIKQQMLKNFIDKSEAYKNVIAASHANLGINSPISNSPLNSTMLALKESTTGGKLADIFIKHGLSDLGSKGLGAGVGGAVGHMVGLGEVGALLGAHALGPFFKSTIPAVIKPLLSTVSNGAGLKAGADYVASVAKGDTLLTRAAKSIFKPIGYTATQNLSEASIAKLDKKLKELQQDPMPLMDTSENMGHYLPAHSTAMSSTTMNAVNYLNSLRPDRTKQAPLDPEPKPSNMQKAAYTKALTIAQQPLSIFESLKKGTMTPNDILTLKTLYPSLYNSMVSKLTQETIDATHKGIQIPYKTKMGISMFVGQPMDSTMTPNSIQATQLSQQPKGPALTNPVPKQKRGTAILSKASQQYMTAGQAAEANQLKH